MNTLEEMLKASNTEEIPEGAYEVRIEALDITAANPLMGDGFEANWEFQILSGPEEGKTFRHRQRLSEKSFRYFKASLVVASGQKSFTTDELYDSGRNQSGPLARGLAGSVVRLAIVHRESGGTNFVNIRVVERLSGPPAAAS